MSRKQYPWKLGATSFVIPASVAENVQFLAGKVDDVQLLLFESSWQARLPNEIDLDLLAALGAEHGHSYTVHLPLDLQLGCRDRTLRKKCVAEVCRLVEEYDVLDPQAYDLHLNRQADLDDDEWCDHCLESLFSLRDRLGSSWRKLNVENIDYPFGLIGDVIGTCQVKTCVDFGHLHHHGFSDANFFSTYDINHVHLHGVIAERDHQPLGEKDILFLQRLGQEMVDNDYGKVVTLELYKSEWLAGSLAVLEQVWSEFTVKV